MLSFLIKTLILLAALLFLLLQLANYLRSQGVRKGDAVAIYMPMLAELPIAMLACARIGAVHSVSSLIHDTCIDVNDPKILPIYFRFSV